MSEIDDLVQAYRDMQALQRQSEKAFHWHSWWVTVALTLQGMVIVFLLAMELKR